MHTYRQAHAYAHLHCFQGNIHQLWATNRISLLSVNGVQTTKLSPEARLDVSVIER